jgi:hypothetical protein
MSILSSDPITQLSFSLYENRGIFALLLGSGVSRAAEIPTGWEITIDLIRRIALAQGVENQTDWAAWYKSQTGDEVNYSTLIEDLATSPEERRSILHRYIEPTTEEREEGRKVPTAAHRSIAEIVRAGYVRLIVTTNFDRLLENALREVGVEPTLVTSPDALAGAEPIAHSDCYILKLHGDYKDARILNTENELSGYPAQYEAMLDRIFDEYGLIVAGWSGEWDYALRAAFLRSRNRRYPIYWATRGELGDGANEIVNQLRAHPVKINDADELFDGIWQRIQTLQQTHRLNPLSVDLLVNSAKRYLGKSEHRIQLDELVEEEAQRIILAATVSEFSPEGSWSDEVFRSRVARYQALTEPLAKIVGVLGRWGDGSELPLLLNVIRSVHSKVTVTSSGMVHLLHLRDYPTVLLFTAYGLGLVRASQWNTFHKLLTAQLNLNPSGSNRVVDNLFIWAWAGGQEEYWCRLEGLEHRKTPLSDHQCELFSDWGKSFVGIVPHFELLFERFEMLASLAFLEVAEEKDVRAVVDGEYLDNFIWMPIGRSAWNSQIREQLIGEFENSEFRKLLLDAGFAKKNESFLDLYLKNFQRLARKFSFR